MKNLLKRSLSLGAMLLLPAVLGLGEEYELSMFDESIPGFLYSYGQKKYVGSIADDSSNNILVTVKDRSDAMKMFVRFVKNDQGIFASMISAEEKHKHACNSALSQTEQKDDSSFFGCPSIFAYDKDSNEVGLRKYDGSSLFQFIFSLPVLAKHHAVRIYHGNKCLTAKKKNSVVLLDECEYDDMDKKIEQLFIWVNNDLFNAKVNPLYTIDAVQNPSNPYYMPDLPDTTGLNLMDIANPTNMPDFSLFT
ncbi:hypothetical protein NECID01_1471 [Nematocida sp. AWRm77]|nr:hypothetical protein NECID01_1471 [Nematocida sp. AWRm77]